MSFKFRRDGAVFPTEVKNGGLIIHMGSNKVKVRFKFLKEDYEYDNTDYSMCNIMCYLKNETGTTIMRFDGTVTRFDADMNVIGFTKFSKDDIYSKIQHLPVGLVVNYEYTKIKDQMSCTVYTVPDSNVYILECAMDPEPIEFNPVDNPLFVDDIAKGNRYSPRLVKEAPNVYIEENGKYRIIGNPIHTTGYIEV
jgi:hypothetical protein